VIIFKTLFAVFFTISVVELVIIVRKNLLRRIHRGVRLKISRLASQLRDCNSDVEIYNKILATLMSIFPCASQGSFLIIDKKNEELMRFAAIYNLDKKLINETIPTKQSFLFLYNRMKEVAIVKNPAALYLKLVNSHSEKIRESAKVINESLMAPIYFENKVFGVVNITTLGKNRFKRSDIALCKYILDELNMILEYFITKNEMNYVIEYDSLTKIHSRDAFLGKLNLHIASLKDDDESIFIMIDLDNFKEINDNFGHLVGDKALAYFARAIKNNIRPVDDCGRYGGDEFGILFRNCDMNDAIRKMKYIQKYLEDNPFRGEIVIKFSFGAASIRKKYNYDLKDVIAQADTNMYKSKSVKK